MEALATYLVLSGYLNPGEALLFQKIIKKTPSSITKKRAKNYLRESGFTAEEVFSGLQMKELVNVDKTINVNWEGIGKFTNEVRNKLMTISHDLMELKLLIEEGSQETISEKLGSEPLTPEKILLKFDGNKTTKPESKLLEGENVTVGVETIERMAEIGILKIHEKKRSRKISLTSEGSALRYLFLKKPNFNSANYDYLEKTFLSPNNYTWESFLEHLNRENDANDDHPLPSWFSVVLIIFINLGVIIQDQEESKFSLSTTTSSLPFDKKRAKELEEGISGFIPMYVNRMFEVLVELNDFDKPKDLQHELSLGSSSINGILNMLTKFRLVAKNEKNKTYQLTNKGKKLSSLDNEEFKEAFRENIQEELIFIEVGNFINSVPDKKFGFMDLAGFFRVSGVSNFNPAKSLSVIRLMTQLNMDIEEIEDESGTYRLIENIEELYD